MENINTWIFLSKIIGILSLAMAIYGLYSGRVYGRSWEKYIGGWVYKTDNPDIYRSYILMYFAITFFMFICSIVFGF